MNEKPRNEKGKTIIMDKIVKEKRNIIEKEKSDIIYRTIVIKDGKEKVVEENLGEMSFEDSLVSDNILNDIFDRIYSE